MSSNNSKSPYATSFNSAIKRGTPAGAAVKAIATRSQIRPNVVFASLHKANLCHRQKFNGQWIYWAVEGTKSTATTAKNLQVEIWQSLIDWCIASGHCQPQQLADKASSQRELMSYCRTFFNRQFPSSTSRSSKAKRTSSRKTPTTSYKFPRSSSKTRRYRRAA